MIRQLSILTLVIALVGCVQSGPAQPRSSTPTSQAGLDEASRLNKLVEKLYGEAKFDLEAALSAASAEFRAQNEPITLATMQAALLPDAMLVEFARYRRLDAWAKPPAQEERYIAYLVTSHGPPHWVPLGKAAPIDAAVDAVLAALKASVHTEATRAALQHLRPGTRQHSGQILGDCPEFNPRWGSRRGGGDPRWRWGASVGS